MLLLTTPDQAPASWDTTKLPLPIRSPALKLTYALAPLPSPTLHLTLLSDSHSVASTPLPPTRPIPLVSTSPNMLPVIVTLLDPLPKTLLFVAVDTPDASYDTACDPDPATSPTLSASLRLPPPPDPARQTTPVSDTQKDISHPVPPTEAPRLELALPNDVPDRLTTDDPLRATFPRYTPDTPPTSWLNPCVNDPATPCTDTDTDTDPPAPELVRRTMAVSDTHRLSSAPLPPTRPCPLVETTPKLPPDTVTTDDPLRALLMDVCPETPAPKLNPCVNDPATPCTDTDTETDPPAPELVRRTMAVSDTHRLSSAPLPPTRPCPLVETTPKLPPDTVTKVDPLLMPFTVTVDDTPPAS
mmetsp:Transcript_5963/g.19280  ORF Transcript_5963/g.19280 Transcript_5963/m.19280 type:complete len:357 (+) Transcript_5963:904-1974(+)